MPLSSMHNPLIDELLEKLTGYQVVSKLDLSEGSHQIPVAPEDVHKTAFVSQFGAYEYLVMQFGLANASAQFTLLMNSVLQGIDFEVVFTDDILVFSPSLQKHHKHVRTWNTCVSINCTAPQKCKFYGTSVEYLGHVITPEGTTVVSIQNQSYRRVATTSSQSETVEMVLSTQWFLQTRQ